MDVAGIGSPSNLVVPGREDKTANMGKSELKMSDFFKLMVAQLTNQSMYDSVDNSQFMSQMVQFSTLSRMEEMTNAFQGNLAVSMIGKQVAIADKDEYNRENVIQGEVTQVNYQGGKPYVMVNGQSYTLDQVSVVREKT
ncbi:flagellar hook capping FlgD N-terminal domain-containing protein [Bacillota bacterium Meth-B3]